jgi:hypothetical protein
MEAMCGVQNHAFNNLPVFPEMQEGGGGWQLWLAKKVQSNNTFILQYIK